MFVPGPRADRDHDDISFTDCSSAGTSGSIDGDDESGPSNDETGPVDDDDDDEAGTLKKIVQDSVLRLVEVKQKNGLFHKSF